MLLGLTLSYPALAQGEQMLAAAVVLEPITVTGQEPRPDYRQTSSGAATRTDTPLRDVPQAVSVVTQERIADQSLQSLGDVLRYTPGVAAAQGEGHRDAPILRGNTSTADLFVDGVRDDVQYLRDLYNVERVEVLKGPNAMIFGRGGTGGVINRVTRLADGERRRALSIAGGSFGHQRVTADVSQKLNTNIDARATALFEDSDSHRDDVSLRRYGINPSLRLATGANTTLMLAYEYFNDDRTTDRGGPSQSGRPFAIADSDFFGDPSQSESFIELNVVSAKLTHRFSPATTLNSSLSYGNYDKLYDNVFAATAVSNTGTVGFDAYRSATERRNLFSQTDLVHRLQTGGIGHTLLAGVELGRQVTDNLRLTGRFADGADADSNPDTRFTTTVANANFRRPLVDFVQGGSSDGNNLGTTTIAAVYVQDQIRLSPQWQAVAGLRYDRFSVDFSNRRSDAGSTPNIESTDSFISPRLGLVYKPMVPVSIYGSYSVSSLPRAGEQLSSLTPSTRNLDPEEYRNYELGAKWDIRPNLSATAAVYRLERDKVLLVNPIPGGASFLGNGAVSEGFELELTGKLSKHWTMAGGYAWQDARLSGTANATSARDGAVLAQTPKHSGGLWNRYQFTPKWGAGLGVVGRSAVFATTSNAVRLPGYARIDGAAYYQHSPRLKLQINAENLGNTDYSISAHNDNNILPGAPLTLRASVHLQL
jgi:catecholate siderophore receptor